MTLVAFVLVGLGATCFAVRAVRGPSLADRVVAVDGLVVSLVAAVVVHWAHTGSARFLVVAVVSAFVGFVGTLAGARFIERRGA